jgi:Abortive infection C-terminus
MSEILLAEVVLWLEDGGAAEAAALLRQCAIRTVYVDELVELSGNRIWSLFDAEISAPRPIYDLAKGEPNRQIELIESALRSNAEANEVALRGIAWVPLIGSPKVSPAAEEISQSLSNVDSVHVHQAWSKALKRKNSDPEGAITAARTLVEAVCKHILDRSGVSYPSTIDLPKLYHQAAQRLQLAPNQQTDTFRKQLCGNCQAVVTAIGTLRNQAGDAHGKGTLEAVGDRAQAELALNLAGAIATFLVQVWEATSGLKAEVASDDAAELATNPAPAPDC